MPPQSNDDIFCPSCGLRIQPDYQYCTGCGAPVQPIVLSPKPQAVPKLVPPPSPLPRKEKAKPLLVMANYVISIVTFIVILIFLSSFLQNIISDESSRLFITIFTASSIAGFVGGMITKQSIPFKVVGTIVLVIAGFATILIFLAYQSAQQSTSPYAPIGFLIILIVVLAATLLLTVSLFLHALFSYIGAKVRE